MIINKLYFYFFLLCLLTSCVSSQKHAFTNSLIHEKSPYLLQHAHNPVQWNAWNEKTLQLAEKEQKLLVISIGYAACHWCHVMEKESFSDSTTAYLMNKNFINIKIDREERPDIDNIYMNVCSMTNESGCGWPLNVIALPNGQPVWVGSYLEKKQWQETLNFFLDAQKKDTEKLKNYALYLKESLANAGKVSNAGRVQNPASVKEVDSWKDDFEKLVENIVFNTDTVNGGMKGVPKFATPALFDFLLNASTINADRVLNPVSVTTTKWAKSALYDQLEGGFHRYAVDSAWQVPHFEKMLYDNALMVSLYSKAYQHTKNERYKQVVEQTFDFIQAHWKQKNGAYSASSDADNGEGEGAYYTWTRNEIQQVLGKNANFACDYFSITEKGNWENGKNILYVNTNIDSTITKRHRIYITKAQLLNERKKRPAPPIDTKQITAWNALLLTAYIDAYKAVGNEKYLAEAATIAQFFIKKQIAPNGKMKHLQYGEQAAFLDDYAFTMQSFIALYQATFEVKYLQKAQLLADYVLQHFQKNEAGFYEYAEKNELFTQSNIDLNDDVMPSANACFANALFDLGIFFQKENYTQIAQIMAANMKDNILKNNTLQYHYAWASLYQKMLYPHYEIAIVGENAAAKRKELLQYHLPNALIMGTTKTENLPLLKDKFQKGETMIYVCQKGTCKLPTESVAEVIRLLIVN